MNHFLLKGESIFNEKVVRLTLRLDCLAITAVHLSTKSRGYSPPQIKKHRQGTEPKEVLSHMDNVNIA